MTFIFYFLALVSVISALCVVFSKNPVYSVLYLVVTFFSIAAQFLLLNAQFLAAVHIIVYAGAIMVLFLFVIMLLNIKVDTESHTHFLTKLSAVISGGLLGLVLLAGFKNIGTIAPVNAANANIGLVENLGKTLFNQFLLPFEVSSLLFLSAMIGAVMLAKKELN